MTRPTDDEQLALMNLRAARQLVAALTQGGPRQVVVSPGARSAPLVLALSAHPQVRCHVVLDERAAGFMALGLAKAQGQAAVLVCTSGSAGGHYLPAVMEAYHSLTPLIVVTADRPEELLHQGAAQTTEQEGLFARHVRAARRLPTPRAQGGDALLSAWGLFAKQMVALAEGPMAGPVHLNAPFAEPLVPTPQNLARLEDDPGPRAPSVSVPMAPAQPTAQGLVALQGFLRAHPRGVIVCGPLPALCGAQARTQAVLDLAQALAWPILADPLSGLRFGAAATHRPLVLSRYDALLKAGRTPPPADGVLVLGGLPTSKALQRWLAPLAGRILSVHEPERFEAADALASLTVGADVTALCQSLLAAGAPQGAAEHLAAWQCWDAKGAPEPVDDLGPLSQASLWPAVLAALPEGAGLHVGSSMPVRGLDTFSGAGAKALRISANRGLNGIDGCIATLLGLALGDRRPWLGVLGDLTFLHDVGALQAARQGPVTVTLVVCNNHGGAIFGGLPIAQHTDVFERYFRTPQAADLGLLCAACACGHEVVYTPAGLRQAVATAMARPEDGRLHVIEALFDGAAPPCQRGDGRQSAPPQGAS